MKLVNIFDKVKKPSNKVIFGAGLVGFAVTGGLAIHATVKAVRKVDQEKPETKAKAVKCCWKVYIPTMVVGTMSYAAVLYAYKDMQAKEVALVAALLASRADLADLKDAVHEVTKSSDGTENDISKLFAQKRVDRRGNVEDNSINQDQVMTPENNQLILDATTGRYFRMSKAEVEKSVTNVNWELRDEPYVTLNDLYDELNIPHSKIGDMLGWTSDRPIEVFWDSAVAENGESCLVMDFAHITKDFNPNRVLGD